jgi:hypothetical protein
VRGLESLRGGFDDEERKRTVSLDSSLLLATGDALRSSSVVSTTASEGKERETEAAEVAGSHKKAEGG